MHCVVLKRCSSSAQVATSITNQGLTTEDCIRENDLHVVHEELLEGVTGSIPGNRTDIDSIIQRKRTRDDFQLLVVQDATRFTRAGQGHGQKLIYDLRAAGILVYFLAENILVDSEMAEMYISFLFSAARESVKRIAYGATSGTTNSFLAGRSPYSRRPPYGIDRMYCENNQDQHFIRNLSDGTQEQRNAKTGELIRRFGCNTRRGIPNHYIKQKSEQVRLIPGDPKLVAVVVLIFHLHDVQHKSPHTIAKHLNDTGITSPSGREWSTSVVRQILRNPIYIGRGIRYRRKTGIFFNGGAVQPIPSEVDVAELANRRRPRQRRRTRDQWVEQAQPQLAEFLPIEIRELATLRIQRYLDSIAGGKSPHPQRDRHLQSQYLLKRILRSKQGHHAMTGVQSGKKDHTYRYYAVSRAQAVPKSNDLLRRRIPAEPLEKAVIDILRATLLNKPDLMAGLKQILASQQKQQPEVQNVEEYRKELKRCRNQLAMLADDVNVENEDDALSRKVAEIKRKISDLQQRVTYAQNDPQRPRRESKVSVEKLANDLEEFGKNLDPRDTPGIAKLLELLVERMEVDLETRDVDIVFALPSWMAQVCHSTPQVGLDALSVYKPIIETHPENGFILAVFVCKREEVPRHGCFTCRRLPLGA
jgi:hypothetical protein